MKDGCQDAVPLLGPALDGELAAEDRRWLGDHLAGCATCRERQALLAAQGVALREALERSSAQVDFSRFTQRVLARVEAQQRAHLPLGERLRALWWESIRPHRLAFAGGGLAAAACGALLLALGPLRPARTERGSDTLLASADQAQQAQIEEFEVYGQQGTVLQFPGQSTLIWIDEEAGKPPAGRPQ